MTISEALSPEPSPFKIVLGNHAARERARRVPSRVFQYVSADEDYWEIIKCSHEPQWIEDPPPTPEQIDRLARSITFLQKPLSNDPFQKRHTA